ncbi:hypothetical protein TIFTF001_035096 [Ficus carica]|uniref:Uncharacterized protein n=1 Tax=Ficus carica TaxID=3494 RepID=A0AA88E473_FICCA|nr:hypothetical protein TIFTF001_035096 [Ficus carica]
MAEIVAAAVIKGVLPLIVDEAISLYGVKDQVDSAREKLQDMYVFIRNAEKQLSAGDEMLSYFVLKMKEAAHDLEDVLATYLSSGSIGRRVNAKMIHGVQSEMEKVLKRLSKLWADVFELQKLETLREDGRERSLREREQRETFGHNTDMGVVGFEENIDELVANLTDGESHRGRVIGISGMGGLGKTTLAREVYNDSRVRAHFDCFGWVYVSRHCQVKRDVWETLLIDLIESPTEGQRGDIARLKDGEVARKLYNMMKEKKCLVVLDDIWASETWGNLKAAFPVANEMNSKILITTRNILVAQGADPDVFVHELGCLGDDKSWELFMNKASLGNLAAADRRKREELGREMVKHCAGLPLAIELLGGILSQRSTVYGWEVVHRHAKRYINEGGIQNQGTENSSVSWVLGLSYHELPCELKPCFLFLAHFPESLKIINVKELCQMWIAEGLVLSRDDQLEDAAYDYFHKLVGRYMVRIGGQNSTGKIKTCHVHDLVRDFCLSQSRSENFLEIVDLRNKHRPRDFELTRDRNHVPTAKVRRLVINLNNNVADELHPIIKQNDRCLRILKFNNHTPAKFVKFPNEIGNLIFLRLLSLRKSHVQELPSSVGKLRSLLNLDLQIISSVQLPNVIGNLEQLRHLYLPAVYNVKGQTLQLNNLQSLQTLVNVSTSSCDMEDLVQLTRLKKLKIRVDTYQELNVPIDSTFEQLESLAIAASTLEHLQPVDIEPLISICPNIRKLQVELPILTLPEDYLIPRLLKLTLRHTRLNCDPMPMLERLQDLRILVLGTDAFIGTEMVCSQGGFCQLESLSLVELKNLNLWTVMNGAFPSLSHLHIEDCIRLSEVPDGLRHVLTLKKMVIKTMSMAFCWRVKAGEDFVKVQHVESREYLDI